MVQGESSFGREVGLGREEVLQQCIIYGCWDVGPWESWEAWDFSGGLVLLGCPDVLGGCSGQEVRPVRGLGPLYCLKVALFGSLAKEIVSFERCFFMVHMALWYSLRNVVGSGDHQGLALRDGRERGVFSSKRAVRELSEDENQVSSWDGDGCEGAGGTQNDRRRGPRDSQSARSQQGVLGRGFSVGGERVIRMGTWSEPVEGRVVVSPSWKDGDMSAFAKARSIAPGLWEPERGKRV